MVLWNKTDSNTMPDLELVDAYVNNDLWNNLRMFIETEYQSKPALEYSSCSMQKGWNLKYRKSGRTLCTLYPMDGFFIALIIIGELELTEAELMLPSCTQYFQKLYLETKAGMGQKWLMINVSDEAILDDVKKCIAIRRGVNRSKKHANII